MHGMEWMQKVMYVLFVLIEVCTAAFEIQCLHIYDSLKQHVRSSHTWPVLEDADACMADAFIKKSLMYMNSTTLDKGDGVFVLTNDSLALAELLTFSLMGRHFDNAGTNDGFFFKWNRYYETLSVELAPCEFSRPLYNFVLLFTLLTLLSIVVMQQQVKMKSEQSEPVQPEKEKVNGGAVGFRSPATAVRAPL
jgi:hypothetical protein